MQASPTFRAMQILGLQHVETSENNSDSVADGYCGSDSGDSVCDAIESVVNTDIDRENISSITI